MRLVLFALLPLALGCGSGVEVRGGGADPSYDFGRLRTYAWLPRETTGDSRIDDEGLDRRVRAAADAVLAGKGYRLVDKDADFLVGYRAVLGRQRSVEPRRPFEGIWTEDHAPRPAGGEPAPVDKVETEGTLVLRIHDGKSRKLVWEAAADTEIKPETGPLPTAEDKVKIAIREMLKRFPP